MTTKTISHYEILAPIGEGGMGVVYRALDTRLGRPVAVKLLRHDGVITSESRKRFVQEARAASALNHPHIITIYEIGQDQDVDFIAMEYLAGQSLAHLIGHSGLRLREGLKYAVQIADALAAAHAAGILHRDLKPANIMVSDKGLVKVLDFGLAKLTEPVDFQRADERVTTGTAPAEGQLQTEEGRILGTAPYMSPEQAEGKPTDARSDVFSFGAVLYEMITGRRAFSGTTKMSALAAILTTEPEPPSRVVPGLSRDLEKMIVRCLRKSPERRWQSMADLKVALEDLLEESDSRSLAEAAVSKPAHRRTRALVTGLATIAIGALMFGAWWRASRPQPVVGPKPFLTRLTSDVGWTDYPAISLDGKILAYASDRSGEGNLDIWVQQIPDGSPVRLTRHAADDVEPSLSADGSKVAFQSSRLGGGIYLIPTLGGEERLLAARGFSPRFSPDGNWIAYGLAEQAGGRLYVAPAAGGPATLVAAGFYRARAPVWSPDGRYLLFWAQRERDAPPENNIDWYVAAIPGGSPVATEARGVLLREGFQAFQGLPFPEAWVRAGNRILFHGIVGDSSNLWQVALSLEKRRVSGTPQRATFGTTDEAAASVSSDGRMVFISLTMGADIWSLPIDANRARLQGPLKRVTQDAADDYDPTLSEDGATLVFRSRRAGRFGVVLRRLGTSAETVLTRMPEDHYPAVSRDGTKVAYSLRQDGKMPIFVVAANGGTPEQVCDDCGEVEAWSGDGDQILYVAAGDPSGVGLLKLGSSHNDVWLRHSGYGIYNPRLSSDGGWIAFNGRTDRLAPAQILVAKVQASVVALEKDWIVVIKDGDAPSWSPDANLLYFWSDRDGSPCLWAQRLDSATKRPTGLPLSIQHFHSKGLSWKNLYLGAPRTAVARDKIVFNLGEHTGNVWMTQLPRTPD
jgi:eukaryotic-like serine/threonine-protein kinase